MAFFFAKGKQVVIHSGHVIHAHACHIGVWERGRAEGGRGGGVAPFTIN